MKAAKAETAAGRDAAKEAMLGGVAVDPQTGTDVTLAGLRGDLAHFRKLKGNGQMLGALRARNDIYRRILQTAGNGKDVKGLAREALATLEGVDDLFDLLRKVP